MLLGAVGYAEEEVLCVISHDERSCGNIHQLREPTFFGLCTKRTGSLAPRMD